MPRHGINAEEKSKDFKGSMLRLFKMLDKWRFMMILAILLAMFSAVLSTIAPNKLADVTDVISDGIKPNIANLESFSKEMMKHSTIANSYVPREEETSNPKEIISSISSLSDEELAAYFTEFTFQNEVISVDDQVQFIRVISSFDASQVTEDFLEKVSSLPKSIQHIIEPKMDEEELKKRSIILGVIYIISSIFGYLEGLIMAYVGIGFSKKLRSYISSKINVLPLKYFDTHETGDILSRVTNDVDSIGINMSNTITSFVSNITLFLGSIIMMFVTNWVMALTAIASSIIGFGLSFLLLKTSQKYFTRRQKELGELNGHIEEIYSGHNVVKAYNGEESAMAEFDRINNQLYHSNRMSQFLSGIMQPIMGFIGNFGYVAVCVVGALLVMNHKISFGVIVAFMIYIRMFTNPLSRIAQAMTTMQSIAAAAERVFEFVDEKEFSSEDGITGYLEKKKVKGNIEFDHVKFGYDSKKTIIKDFSAKVKSGQKIAIVGPTGAGKTTMVNLLMKFYDIQDGDIRIDGESIRNLRRDNIHELFIMVLQDTWLFDGTIRENIQYNQKNVTDEAIWNACKTVGIDHFIKTLPGALDARVGDNEAISSGQKQLITIARGMIEDAPFLILDEATSNVDTRTEELVQKAMDKLTEGRTSFIIAHRLSTIKNADLILVMNEGNIVEQGKHEDLLAKGGFYANLYNSQFQK